jgi:hypothetical protein
MIIVVIYYIVSNSSNSSSSSIINTYKFKTKNVSKEIADILEIPRFNYDKNFNWTPPTESGLSNSDYIIQPYYKFHDFNDINYLNIIKDNIRNFRELNKYEMEYIKKLSHEDKNTLFDIYNNCTKLYNDIII